MLEADPQTDWSKVNIEALRQHLIDMNNVTLEAKVTSEPVDGGMRFDVTGEGPVRDSIRRMVMAHAATMNGVDGWHFQAATTESGATLSVVPPSKDLGKLHGLGFIGVMTRGMHHQEHHLEGDERRELSQRFALAAPIATPVPQPAENQEPTKQRRPWWRRLVG